MTTKCPVCSSDKIVIAEARLDLYKCRSCTHAFTVLPKDKQEEYRDDYFNNEHKNWFNNPDTNLFEFIYKQWLRYKKNEEKSLLDVGCGNGTFLRYVYAKSPKARLVGIDLADNNDPNIRFIEGDFLKEEIGERFGAIASLVTIEHIDSPHLFIKKISDCLDSSGLVFIMTINSNGLIYKIAELLNSIGVKAVHDRLYSQHHINHYTNKSLKRLMEMNGFNILLHKNHNYSIKSVDVPRGNLMTESIYKFLVWLVFVVSMIFKDEYLQTIVCKKRG